MSAPDRLALLADYLHSARKIAKRLAVSVDRFAPLFPLGMKLKALSSLDRGERDLVDAKALAAHLDIRDVAALRSLYASIHGEEPSREQGLRFPAVLADA